MGGTLTFAIEAFSIFTKIVLILVAKFFLAV
jgi:hypothetical protein